MSGHLPNPATFQTHETLGESLNLSHHSHLLQWPSTSGLWTFSHRTDICQVLFPVCDWRGYCLIFCNTQKLVTKQLLLGGEEGSKTSREILNVITVLRICNNHFLKFSICLPSSSAFIYVMHLVDSTVSWKQTNAGWHPLSHGENGQSGGPCKANTSQLFARTSPVLAQMRPQCWGNVAQGSRGRTTKVETLWRSCSMGHSDLSMSPFYLLPLHTTLSRSAGVLFCFM